MVSAFMNFFKDDQFNDEILPSFGKSVNSLITNESLQNEFIDMLEAKYLSLALNKKQWRPLA
jgi:hypothetical protein